MTADCAMCGETMAHPHGGYSLPPVLVEDLQNSETIDVDNVAGKISIDLCAECAEIAERMVTKYETSPLPECDAKRARYTDVGRMEALTGGDFHRDDPSEGMILDALETATLHAEGEDARVARPRVVEALVLVRSAENIGLINETPC